MWNVELNAKLNWWQKYNKGVNEMYIAAFLEISMHIDKFQAS